MNHQLLSHGALSGSFTHPRRRARGLHVPHVGPTACGAPCPDSLVLWRCGCESTPRLRPPASRFLMPILFRIAAVVAALSGRAAAGSITSTFFLDSACTIRDTECGAHNVNLNATTGECALSDVTNKPSDTTEWISGECIACHAGETCIYPLFNMNSSDGVALASQGISPEYAKITCTAGVVTVEHFSDAECTLANKVSNDELSKGFSRAMHTRMLARAPAELMDCFSMELDMQSDINISSRRCGTMMSFDWDEVRPWLLI
eukprot:COSAG02_NODE_1993_length_10163_cov_11.874006_4_plen_261_part_00